MMYTLDAHAQPGEILVVVVNHPTYIAENFHQAEVFAQQLLSSEPILLAAPSDAEALIARVLARVGTPNTMRSWLELGEALDRLELSATLP